jgi:hypothetical protein
MSLLDASGCLSPAGIAAVGAAAPGRIPAEVAAHLASCARCQERVLTGGLPRAARKATPSPPSLKRAFLLVGLIVLSILAFLWTLRRLTG